VPDEQPLAGWVEPRFGPLIWQVGCWRESNCATRALFDRGASPSAFWLNLQHGSWSATRIPDSFPVLAQAHHLQIGEWAGCPIGRVPFLQLVAILESAAYTRSLLFRRCSAAAPAAAAPACGRTHRPGPTAGQRPAGHPSRPMPRPRPASPPADSKPRPEPRYHDHAQRRAIHCPEALFPGAVTRRRSGQTGDPAGVPFRQLIRIPSGVPADTGNPARRLHAGTGRSGPSGGLPD
jgi:hypothetical protein